MKQYRKLLSALLAVAMLFGTVGGALAAEPDAGGTPPADMGGEMPPDGMSGGGGGEMPPDGMGGGDEGGGGGTGSASQEFATFDEVRSSAIIQVENGTASVTGEGVTASDTLTADGVSGIVIDGGVGTNGLAISLESETDTFTIGGDELLYEVDGKSYNSVIQVQAGEGNNDAGYEAVYGVGVGINTGELRIKNSYISSDGPRSTPVYAFSNSSPEATSLVVENSTLVAHSDDIWMPSFKLLAGGARATLLMTRNNSWFYGSTVISNNWGAISQDSVDATTYVINSLAETTEGGYGTYLTYGMRFYGSELYGGQYGIFMCGTSDIITDTGAAALDDADAMSKLPDYPVDTEAASIVAAPFNAIVVHTSLPTENQVATGVFRNTTLSTLTEDLPDEVTPMAADDDFLMPGVDILGSGNGCGASYFFSKNLYGSLALIRSMNANFTFDNADLRTSNGVLVQSVISYDPPSASGYLSVGEGDNAPGISVTFLNGDYTGNILHEDYQRSMNVTVGDGATLDGYVVSGTWAAWSNLWSEENLTAMLAEDGYTPDVFNNPDWVADVQTNLIQSGDADFADTDNYGVDLTVAAGGTWYVTGTSTLSSLTIEEGGKLISAEGNLAVYINCDTSNSLLSYDYSNATKLSDLAPGTYENVTVVLVEDADDTAAPAPSITFSDVNDTDWFFQYVQEAASKGVINGYGDGTFRPNNTLTRAEAVTMLVLGSLNQTDAYNYPTTITEVDLSAVPSFTDCTDHWAAAYIAAAEQAGFISGYGDGTFHPDDTMTRAELAALICQVRGGLDTQFPKSFSDVSSDQWYAKYVEGSGILSGYEDGTYRPNNKVTRAEFVTVIYTMFLQVGGPLDA